MGIPKFFRWMSERYPLCSQLITENRIPEFDNLYLDMNGIIHHCSHPNDVDAHYRVSEDKIFIEIFNYIDHLFTKIKPKQLFFMAVDGVAPRAKMNQQRARRFRTAKEAADAIKKAESRGETLPPEKPFDSNCITPGTEFMAKLSLQLQYFINKKVTEDSNWKDIKIVLSGHEVPGEGEHKIMEHIRNAKAQADYNPNVRHCLYGLDADLIMLGLLSHDPHFALLREEVTFGSSKRKKQQRVESQNFYLMHLSLLREYLDLEFSALRETLPFDYNLERIIDDFILLALFVGNDFLPHLPNLHIAEGALGLMFRVYKGILPNAGGYINDGGILDVKRLEMIFKELSNHEREVVYEGDFVDIRWFKGKQRKYLEMLEEERKNKKLVLTPKQREIYDQIKDLVEGRLEDNNIYFPSDYPARDRVFIENLAKDLGIHQSTFKDEETEEKCLYVEYDPEESDEDIDEIREKVFERYEAADIIEEDDAEAYEERERKKNEEEFIKWKKKYYKEKMHIDYDDIDQMDKIVGSYIEGLQWVLHYYYKGVASWGWFYPYHYSPKISDLIDLERFDIQFEKGEPFTPFEQLMGVLPEGSKKFLPEAYQDLMTNPNSPIIDFYPQDFEHDMNGKKQEWEAVVIIPFIDQKRLVSALRERKNLLTEEEKRRDSIGESLLFTYDSTMNKMYPSSLPDFLPDIVHCRCRVEAYDAPTLGNLKLVKGLCDGVQLGIKAMAGFPSLQTLSHTANILPHGVNVFNSESKNETIVITIINQFEDKKSEDMAREKVNKRIFVDWPFLREGIVRAISDELFRYELSHSHIQAIPHSDPDIWRRKADKYEQNYSKRFGTITGDVNVMVHVSMLKGLKSEKDGALVKEYDVEEEYHAIQTTVDNVECEDSRYEEKPAVPLAEEFPKGTQIYYLGNPYYGCPGEVSSNTEKNLSVNLVINKNCPNEPEFGSEIAEDFVARIKYLPSYQVARKLGISGLTLSKLTAPLHVKTTDQKTDQRVNLGLNLKFEYKKQKVLGYTRKVKIKDKDGWEYSEKALKILEEYKEKFPEFIRALDNKHTKDEIYISEDFYPKEEALSKINEIKDWLRTVEVRDFEKVSLDAEQLDKEAIQKIEKASEEFRENSKLETQEFKKLARHQLLKPSHTSTLLQNQKFRLGDRVVFIKDSGRVPIAAKGTIVGIEKSNIDVVFDTTFMSGSTLGDRCSNYRGMTVTPDSLLNLTLPQLNQRPNNGNSRSRHVNSNHQSRLYSEAAQNGQEQYSNTYPYYNNSYQSHRGTYRGVHFSHYTNGSHQRPPNRPRGANGSNGYISTTSSQNQIQTRPRPVPQPQATSGATKYGNQTHHAFRNTRGNGYFHRGNGSRSAHSHFNNGVSQRGRGRGDGKT